MASIQRSAPLPLSAEETLQPLFEEALLPLRQTDAALVISQIRSSTTNWTLVAVAVLEEPVLPADVLHSYQPPPWVGRSVRTLVCAVLPHDNALSTIERIPTNANRIPSTQPIRNRMKNHVRWYHGTVARYQGRRASSSHNGFVRLHSGQTNT